MSGELRKRLQWQLRRGLLELELSLKAFWLQYADNLSESQLIALSQLLALEDQVLWQLLQTGNNLGVEKNAILQQMKTSINKEPA